MSTSSLLTSSMLILQDFIVPCTITSGKVKYSNEEMQHSRSTAHMVYGRDIKYPRHPDMPCSSKHVDTGLDYVRKLKRRNGEMKLVRISTGMNETTAVTLVQIDPNAVPLPECDLSRPFFDISCCLAVNNERETFMERMYLRELYAEGNNITTYHEPRLLFKLPSREALSISCSIRLGWHERDGEREVRPMKTSATSLLQNLWGVESSKDLMVVAGNGKGLKCHRIIFEAHSAVLSALVPPLKNRLVESETGTVKMAGNSEQGVAQLIRYMYGMELSPTEISCELATELLATADKYGLVDMKSGIVKMLYKKEMGWFPPNDLLGLYFLVRDLEALNRLEEYLLKGVMLKLNQEIRECDRFKELLKADPDEANGLVWKLLDLVNSELEKQNNGV